MHCFMCNIRQKDKENIIPITLVEKVVRNVWKFPEAIFLRPEIDVEFNKGNVICCKKCVTKLKRISKVYFQIQTLEKLLSQLRSEVEESIVKVQVENEKIDKGNLEPSTTNLSAEIEIEAANFDNIENGKWLRTCFLKGISQGREQNSIYQILQKFKDSEQRPRSSSQSSVVSTKQHHRSASSDFTDDSESLLLSPSDDNDSSHVPRLRCDKCQFTFKDEIGVKSHMRKKHEQDPFPFHCQACDSKFRTRQQYTVHNMTHTGQTPFICEFCGRGFRMERLLNFHLKNKHEEGGRKFKCQTCTSSFITLTKLKKHQYIHSKDRPTFPCPTCLKKFTTEVSLKWHVMIHSDDNSWSCSFCEKKYSSPSALKSHLDSHTQESKFVCDQCPFGAPSQSALERHRICHGTEKQFKCYECGVQMKHKNSLAKHMKSHANLKNFQCNFCQKSFIDNYKLLRHTRIHEGTRPYTCEVGECGRSFYTKDKLGAHSKWHEKIDVGKKSSETICSASQQTLYPSSDLESTFHQDESLVFPVLVNEEDHAVAVSLTEQIPIVHNQNLQNFPIFPIIIQPTEISGEDVELMPISSANDGANTGDDNLIEIEVDSLSLFAEPMFQYLN